MSIQDIIRAWKDNGYRESLSEEQRAQLPANPIGDILSQQDLLSISGGLPPWTKCTTNGDELCTCFPTDWIACPTQIWCP